MDLSNYHVRKDWQEFDENVRRRSLRTWRQIVIFVSILTSLLFVLSFIFRPLWSGWGAIRTIFVPALYLGFSFWLAIRMARVENYGKSSYVKNIFGIRLERLGTNILIGALAGGILGLSFFLLTIFLLPKGTVFGSLAPTDAMIAIIFQLLLSALGEEFLLRGLAFDSLYERGQMNLTNTIFLISSLNLFMYSIQIARFIGTSFSVWLVIFRISYGFISTVLRSRQDSTITSIACNIIFNSLVAVILPW